MKGVNGRFRDDDRIPTWDLFNERENRPPYGDVDLGDKYDHVFDLLRESFAWPHEMNPSQPLTVGAWRDFIGEDGLQPEALDKIPKFILDNSDVVSFHTYEKPDVAPRQIEFLETYDRPILCTEYLARSRDNTFENLLPLFKGHEVSA